MRGFAVPRGTDGLASKHHACMHPYRASPKGSLLAPIYQHALPLVYLFMILFALEAFAYLNTMPSYAFLDKTSPFKKKLEANFLNILLSAALADLQYLPSFRNT